jgi:transposase-like protein
MEPKTLQAAILYFADPKNCHEYLVARRWPNGVTCPKCGSDNVKFMEKYNRWNCRQKHESPQFTLKTGTVMEDSPIGLDKWLVALWMVVNCKNGVSSYEIHRSLGVTQKTAWFLDHRIRLMLGHNPEEKLGSTGGAVEVDEAYLGGDAKNKHGRKKSFQLQESENWHGKRSVYVGKGKTGRGTEKTPVFGMLDRETRQVRARVVPNVKREVLLDAILNNVEPGGKVYSDSYPAYKALGKMDFVHDTVNHVTEYVRGEVHTNGIENFWALLKRGLKGTYVAVEPFHLDRYIDEQVFRYNNRKLTDAQRFDLATKGMVGKRLTYAEVTGKVAEMPAF